MRDECFIPPSNGEAILKDYLLLMLLHMKTKTEPAQMWTNPLATRERLGKCAAVPFLSLCHQQLQGGPGCVRTSPFQRWCQIDGMVCAFRISFTVTGRSHTSDCGCDLKGRRTWPAWQLLHMTRSCKWHAQPARRYGLLAFSQGPAASTP
jgi:hypothetical protein